MSRLWGLDKIGTAQPFVWGRQIGPFTKKPTAIGRIGSQLREKLGFKVALVFSLEAISTGHWLSAPGGAERGCMFSPKL